MRELTFNLYLDFYDGEKADVENIAHAALAMSRAAKLITYLIEPSAHLRMELISGSEGSLKLNNRLNIQGVGDWSKKIISWSVIGAVGAFLIKDIIAPYAGSLLLDEIFKKSNEPTSQEAIETVANNAAKLAADKAVKETLRDMLRPLEADKAVRGLGVTEEIDAKPIHIVPRSRLRQLAAPESVEEVTGKRVRKDAITVTLLSPFLEEDARAWRFRYGAREITAYIKDADFLRVAISGAMDPPISQGLEMDILLETREKRVDGIWKIDERNILHVAKIRHASPARQLKLF